MRRAATLAVLALASCHTSSDVRSPSPVAPPPLEVIDVPPGGVVTSRQALAPGEVYLLRAEGVIRRGERWQDAEYLGRDGDPFPADVTGRTDIGVDVGQKKVLPARGRKPAPPSEDRPKWLEPCRADHVYHLLVTGDGRPLDLHLVAPEESTGPAEGTIHVALYRLSPGPPALGAPLETVRVPAREKVSVQSRLVAGAGAVYLLQAAGEVQVGGPRHMGDAEFHDYKADGRGYNEGEEGVDFGVGIDEPVIGQGHDPRARKWGPYRRDHVYYALYLGGGHPIGLNYHDTGGKSGVFKDNEGSLPVTIFAAP